MGSLALVDQGHMEHRDDDYTLFCVGLATCECLVCIDGHVNGHDVVYTLTMVYIDYGVHVDHAHV